MAKSTISARAVAHDLLGAVLHHKRALDDTLADNRPLSDLESRDRAFARLLVATVLRRLGQTDAIIDAMLERPLPAKAIGTRDLLRLGVAQLLFLDTPPHAAVATTVELAQLLGHGPHKGLINAVLRRLDREGRDIVAGQDAARMNTPDWLWQSWGRAFGENVCRRIAQAHLSEAPLDFAAKDDVERWAKRLDARVLPTGALRRTGGGAIDTLPGFADGAWWVQDAAAQLPVNLLGDVAGRDVIDLCAAPGGKTAQLAARGARVTAIDRSERRLARLNENLARLRLGAATVIADAVPWRPDNPADAVLIDAPCSATGTIRRHPDVPRLKGPDDVVKLADLQGRLLAAATDMVRPGGLIVYCSCSLQPEEGPAQIQALLDGGAPLVRVPVTASEIGGLADAVSGDGDLRTLPHHLGDDGGMDGFFAARLRKYAPD